MKNVKLLCIESDSSEGTRLLLVVQSDQSLNNYSYFVLGYCMATPCLELHYFGCSNIWYFIKELIATDAKSFLKRNMPVSMNLQL